MSPERGRPRASLLGSRVPWAGTIFVYSGLGIVVMWLFLLSISAQVPSVSP